MKILFLDLEVAPNIAFCWRAGYKLNIGHDNIIKERAIICASYKWGGDKKPKTIRWNAKQCDKKLLINLSKIMIKADIIVTQNGDKFDLKWVNARLAYHNLDPLGDLTSADTLKMAKKMFYLNSFKLDYMGQFFKLGKKLDTGGFQLWKDICLKKCKKSLNKMVKYCEQDVILLEKIYEKIIKYNPSINQGRAITGEKNCCRNCASFSGIRWGVYTTAAGIRYQKYKCKDCGSVYRSNVGMK